MCAYMGRIVNKTQIDEFIYANVLVFSVRLLGSDKPHLNSVIEKEIEVMTIMAMTDVFEGVNLYDVCVR